MRGCLQHDENDCGLACILTICKFLKICVDETALRKNIFLGNDGLSLYGITEVFRTIGMKSLAVEGTNIELYSLLSEEKKPIIIMINEDDEYHYVVLYKTIDYVPSRNNSRVAKAPQSFWLDDILKAHEKALSEGEKNCIDSCTMMQRYGYDLYLIDGPGENIKITTPEDFYTMRAILEAKENEQIYGLE